MEKQCEDLQAENQKLRERLIRVDRLTSTSGATLASSWSNNNDAIAKVMMECSFCINSDVTTLNMVFRKDDLKIERLHCTVKSLCILILLTWSQHHRGRKS